MNIEIAQDFLTAWSKLDGILRGEFDQSLTTDELADVYRKSYDAVIESLNRFYQYLAEQGRNHPKKVRLQEYNGQAHST
ncbi:MAG TPA: hypothetical protein PKC65_05160 [Pyrinomonadaceae bacterium]|nr:hypothetical protein [Pyrinomonadaceae bacterium]